MLSERVAIVTGASSGIGLACAEVLLDEGMRLVLSGQRADRLEAVSARYPGRCAILAGDIVDPGIVDGLFVLATERFGGADVVLNNAGFMVSGKIEELDLDDMARMVRINVEAAFRVMYTAVRHFRGRGGGHLVSTSSSVGRKTAPEIGAYAGTKHAIEALAQSLRMECAGTAVRITNIQPGLVETELHRDYAISMQTRRGIAMPLQPADIARALLFVLQQPAHVRIPELLITPAEAVF